MKKLVNVYTKNVIRGLKSVPLRTDARGIHLDPEDIKTCIMAKARVEEILDDGTTIPLDFTNYTSDNNAAIRESIRLQEEAAKAKLEAENKAKEDKAKADAEKKAAEEKKAAAIAAEAKKKAEEELAAAIAAEEAAKAKDKESTSDKESKK